MAEPILEIQSLHKRFGGLVASDHLSLAVAAGEVHAVIGPNGAGKTTLVAQLAGELRPDGGTIRFGGADITDLPAYRRSLLGLARSFQITSIFQEFSALDNVALAVQAHAGHELSLLARGAARSGVCAIRRARFSIRWGSRPAPMSRPRISRMAKNARSRSRWRSPRNPRLLLLDEPTAGMGPEDSARMVRFLAGLKGSLTILLIEHDMDAVFALADRITVLVYGRAIATGAPAAIRDNEDVRRAYLGADEAS